MGRLIGKRPGFVVRAHSFVRRSALPLGNGFHILFEDVREAVRPAAQMGAGRAQEFWNERIPRLCTWEEDLRPVLLAMRKELKVAQYSTRAEFHLPLFAERLDGHEMGG